MTASIKKPLHGPNLEVDRSLCGVADEILYRHDEQRLEIIEAGRPWSFDSDGALFRLVAEAYRIRLAHLFDPLLAVHTSLVDPLDPMPDQGPVDHARICV